MTDAIATETAVSSEVSRKLSPGPGRSREEVIAHQLARIHRAMIELVAENGYENLKVRDLVQRAGVSSRAFYELFGSKESCFLHIYDQLARRATRRMIASQAGERDWRRRFGLVFEEFARQLDHRPEVTNLTLLQAYRGGPACLERARQAECTFEGMLGDCLARAPGVVVPSLILEGIVKGVLGVSRSHLKDRRRGQRFAANHALVDWALSYVDNAARELRELDRETVWRDTALEPALNGNRSRPTGDRTLILEAAAALAVQDGYSSLTVERIRAAAHVSRGGFQAHFGDVESCYVAALEQRMDEALTRAARAQVEARTWAGGIYRVIAAHCEYISGDPFLMSLLLTGDFPSGSAGQRGRKHMERAVMDQLLEHVPAPQRPNGLELQATSHAMWALFQRHLRESSVRPAIGATLAYLLLAPAVGPREALTAIRGEQGPTDPRRPIKNPSLTYRKHIHQSS